MFELNRGNFYPYSLAGCDLPQRHYLLKKGWQRAYFPSVKGLMGQAHGSMGLQHDLGNGPFDVEPGYVGKLRGRLYFPFY